jgi:hypothetical protein
MKAGIDSVTINREIEQQEKNIIDVVAEEAPGNNDGES